MTSRSGIAARSKLQTVERTVGSLSVKHREWIAGYLFVSPDALGLLIFVGGPMVLSLSLGFF